MDRLGDSSRRNNFGIGLREFLHRGRIHVVAVNVRYQNEIGLAFVLELLGRRGIDIDQLIARAKREAGMFNRGDFHCSSGRRNSVRRPSQACSYRRQNANDANQCESHEADSTLQTGKGPPGVLHSFTMG